MPISTFHRSDRLGLARDYLGAGILYPNPLRSEKSDDFESSYAVLTEVKLWHFVVPQGCAQMSEMLTFLWLDRIG
ncbi:unnamed protein product [Meloidogyne enterolobii]|uniref:Uncharacterized protein n=1 Tax=Meloidogyne enterolobii TaxID=390850 RepID=A0ACB0XQB1_MELEN